MVFGWRDGKIEGRNRDCINLLLCPYWIKQKITLYNFIRKLCMNEQFIQPKIYNTRSSKTENFFLKKIKNKNKNKNKNG